MEDAYNCALFGLLPDSVEKRLGIYGDKDTLLQAEEIIKTNKENWSDQQKRKKENK